MERPLTRGEHDVLVAMISSAEGDEPGRVSPADRRRWLAQVERIRVLRRCGCGTCPSIELADPHLPTGAERSRVVLNAGAPGALLLLFVDDDRPSYLELAPTDLDGRFDEFPPVAAIRFG